MNSDSSVVSTDPQLRGVPSSVQDNASPSASRTLRLGIVIPLKAKAASRDWGVTSACLEQTLRSVEGQTSTNWVAVVVGHERPDFLRFGEFAVEFERLDTPPVRRPVDAHRKRNSIWEVEYTLDKNRKIVRGMQLLRNRGVDYWFALDSDDLIHRELIDRLSSIDLKSGAILDGGYLVFASKRRAISYADMSAICGSTSILRASDCPIPQSLDVRDIQRVPYCRYSHTDMTRYFEDERNGEFVRIKEKLLAYSLGHGDNCSDGFRDTLFQRIKAWSKPYLLGTRLGKATCNDFALS